MTCPACGFESPPSFLFCGRCGTGLAGGEPGVPAQAREADAERRQLTVVFCDLVGSGELAERLDPEELREIVHEYQAACAAAIAPFGGHIAQYLGDGLLIYFGYPLASEDSPQRAVHGGLAILEGLGRLNERLAGQRGLRLAVRVGIHTGPVVTGAVGVAGRSEQLAIGSAPNVAARLQAVAEPDTVVLSGTTYRLVEGFFDCAPLGTHPLKGLSQPVEVYRALRDTGARSRFEVAASRGLVPLVDRQAELAALLGGFERARGGSGHSLTVVGEAGIGKSRLVEMFRERLAGQPHTWLVCRCSPYARGSALQPVVDLLERLAGFERDEPPAARRAKLARTLDAIAPGLPDARPLLGALLSLPPGAEASELDLAPERQRQRTLETLVALVLGLAGGAPLVLAVEDAHWADPSTLELLGLIAGRARAATLLLLETHRPGFTLPWAQGEGAVEVPLGPLGDEHVEQMIEHMSAGRKLSPALLRQMVTKTDGVPMFVEELTRMVLESGQDREGPASLAIPATLHDSLVARLDRLGPAKEVAEVAAVLGREFSYEMLRAVATQDDASLAAALRDLVEADLLQQRGALPFATFLFKHALIQDAAYGLMLANARQQHHRRVAEVLETRFSEVVESRPELLAHHFTEAELASVAIRYWLRAGQRANARSANLEAIDHSTRGLDLLDRLPPSPERDALELGLRTTLGSASVARKGYSAKEVEQAFGRALELCERLGDSAQRFRALMGLWTYYVVRADYATALALAERLAAQAEAQPAPAPRVHALYCLGFTRYYIGDFAGSLEALERGAAVRCNDRDPALTMPTGDDVRIHVLAQLGLTAWHLGFPDRAVAWGDEGITLARRLGHPYGVSFALALAAMGRVYRQEAEPARALGAEGWSIARDKGYSFLTAVTTFALGWAAAEATDAPEGYAQMQGSLGALRSAGAMVGHTMFTTILADVAFRRGRPDVGQAALADAEAALAAGERYFEAEIHRVRAQAAMEAGNAGDTTMSSFRQALEVAGRQGNRGHALRAATGLTALLAASGRGAEARALLAPAYAGFTEGLAAPDLLAAAALLQRLG